MSHKLCDVAKNVPSEQAATLVVSVGSTSAVHYIFSPYILRLTELPTPPKASEDAPAAGAAEASAAEVPATVFEVSTLTLFGGEQRPTTRLRE